MCNILNTITKRLFPVILTAQAVVALTHPDISDFMNTMGCRGQLALPITDDILQQCSTYSSYVKFLIKVV
ncbi:hypothetical protein BDB00DRAFT_796905 [Zychaea mexicana]|uniref:uncharacterized protein n=1 Tax=Zychaea mexicana TaxID=64656 RepID=UPI0022FE5825|nr:uncharacterized protein BDB00DRAFT_796905 [Zychaea mexicana]KAI9498844.1 hypothetical protein BDB00DRAFT_796905 [Zychaea mexicana]